MSLGQYVWIGALYCTLILPVANNIYVVLKITCKKYVYRLTNDLEKCPFVKINYLYCVGTIITNRSKSVIFMEYLHFLYQE